MRIRNSIVCLAAIFALNFGGTIAANAQSLSNAPHDDDAGAADDEYPSVQAGSGTSWIPASTPLYMYYLQNGKSHLMVHGNVLARYSHQPGPRGATTFDGPNWLMGMYELEPGLHDYIEARAMISLDRLTEGGAGYPLLLQTGESWNGIPLVDRQHPHDFVSELSVSSVHEFSDVATGKIYIGYPGEPALGPAAFMHRTSAMMMPDAPIGHHWQDATHITFGVVTAAMIYKNFKLDASLFNGSEPDENRYNFDRFQLNSVSGRLSWNPTDETATQVSIGKIRNPEGDGQDMTRATASFMLTKDYKKLGWWASSIIWGQNTIASGTLESLLLESTWNRDEYSVYTRMEYVQKLYSELGVRNLADAWAPVGAITLGYAHSILTTMNTDLDLGVQSTLSIVPANIGYGTTPPIAFEVFVALHPFNSHIQHLHQ